MKRRFFSLFLAGLFLFLNCGAGSRNKIAPDFTLPSMAKEQSPVTLSTLYQQTPVLLVFWATWCPSCVEEIPELNRLKAEYPEDKLQILSVNVQESRSRVSRFLKKNSMKYPVLLDEHGEVAGAYNLVGLPVSVLLAKGGEILYYGFSLPPNLDQWLEPRSKK